MKMEFETGRFPAYDVVVAGGGMTGVAAAVAAARNGKKTLLLERTGVLGGVATLGLCNILLGGRKYYPAMGKHKVRAAGGIFEELSQRLIDRQAAIDPDDIDQYRNPHGWSHGCCADGLVFVNDVMKVELDTLCREAGVEILFFTDVINLDCQNAVIRQVVVHNKSGITAIPAKFVIDCTGDADLAVMAGAPTVTGNNNDSRTAPVTVLMLVDHVQSDRIFAYLEPDWQGRFRFRQIIADLRERGLWPWSCEIFISMQNVESDCFLINTLRQTGIDGTDARQLTQAMIDGRADSLKLLQLMRQYFPGFANARLRQISDTVGVRETRRIVGDFILTVKDIGEEKHFDDVIGFSGYAWDLPDPERPSHQPMEGKKLVDLIPIPYRVMVPQKVNNLLVAGRSISVERDVLGPLRVMAPCMVMGQAAGTAAALAVTGGCDSRTLPVALLQDQLRRAGQVVDRPHTVGRGV